MTRTTSSGGRGPETGGEPRHRQGAPVSAALTADVRSALPAIEASTLLLHRTDAFPPLGFSAYLARHIAGARLVELPGADAMPYAGDRDALLDEIEEFLTGYRGSPRRPGAGDRAVHRHRGVDGAGRPTSAITRWAELLDRHDAMVAAEVRRFRGREIKSTGDGVLATFDAPGRAIRCAARSRRRGGARASTSGPASTRVRSSSAATTSAAWPSTSRSACRRWRARARCSCRAPSMDLLVGSGIDFDDRGEHALKGVAGSWRIFAVGAPA